ncbi:fimbrial protein [Enterobacter sp. KBR-315C3_2022]|uniref:fimbrial protein n=1 Tax=Enterobacter sp. KBR-315C3_2022 TaxID=3242494 RepID=UPI003529427A
MKKNIIIVALISGILGSSSVYSADTGNINVKGLITSSTCSIDVNGENNGTVELPTLPSSVFTASHPDDGETPFTINLTRCDDVNSGAVNIVLTKPVADSNPDILPTSGTTKNVAFRIMHDESDYPTWNSPSAGSQEYGPITIYNGGASLGFTVYYHATDFPVKAGTLGTVLKMGIEYQ